MPPHRDRWRDAPARIAVVLATCLVSAVAIADPPPPPAAVSSASSASSTAPASSSSTPFELTHPARAPLPPRAQKEIVPWIDQIELGGSAVWDAKFGSSNDRSGVTYRPAIGFGLHARWEMLSFLQFSAYFVDATHGLIVTPGALSLGSRTFDITTVHTYNFGARFQPFHRFNSRVSGWLSAGIGWGRMEYARMNVCTPPPGLGNCAVFARASPFVELPLGFGIAFDIVPGWLALEYEFNGALVKDQGGEAVRTAQTLDAQGRFLIVGGFAPFTSSLTQTLGLSLKL